MDRNTHSSRQSYDNDCSWTQKIVDDPKSSNPHALIPWLKRQLQTFVPINNKDYNPTLPTAS